MQGELELKALAVADLVIERDEVVVLLFEARYERAMANVRRTRELAERAQAKLDAQGSRE